jgi:hypothetical protein
MRGYSNRSLCVAVLVLFATAPALRGADKPSRCTFAAEMRTLWEDHVTWTRLFLVEATAGLPSKDATTERLLRNQVDIGNAIKPFYGEAAGAKLSALLRDHILVAAELVTAAAAGDTAKKDDANRRWLANADEIAAFLTAANAREWQADATRKMMRDHLELTTQEVVAHLGKDWQADIAAYDRARTQILHMADMLSAGIVAQFPEKFTG